MTARARECVMYGPEKTDGRMIPVRCIDARCFVAARCALEENDAASDERCPVLTDSNLGMVLGWLNKRGLGRSTYRLDSAYGHTLKPKSASGGAP